MTLPSRVGRFDRDYVVTIIGGGGGVGAAAAEHFGRLGASVFVVDKDATAAAGAAAAAASTGGRAGSAAADARDLSSVQRAVDKAAEWNGRVHAVVNAAAARRSLGQPSLEVAIDELSQDLTCALVITHAVVPLMFEHEYGRIAHLASIVGMDGKLCLAAYSAGTERLFDLVKSQGEELAATGIIVNALLPAVLPTPVVGTRRPRSPDHLVPRSPTGRTGTVAEVTAMLRYMISPECGHTTGATFDLDGSQMRGVPWDGL
jgi:NAD(P)-dependent dehydrogenase (short-subunit alcohol dehydrogenase family)